MMAGGGVIGPEEIIVTPPDGGTNVRDSIPLIEVEDRADLDPYTQVDPFFVGNKEPEFYYCWLRDKPGDVEKNRKLVGYEIVTKDNKGEATPLINENAVGEYHVGDTVLARMPMARHERLEANRVRRVREEIMATNAQFISANEQFTPFDTTRIETREGRA